MRNEALRFDAHFGGFGDDAGCGCDGVDGLGDAVTNPMVDEDLGDATAAEGVHGVRVDGFPTEAGGAVGGLVLVEVKLLSDVDAKEVIRAAMGLDTTRHANDGV